ncbi:unnamed protein product, partial [Mesorhabditis belari]|uniref:SXP/RAL-2 family protein Ani s 5-like cation-binding domain-containing protein n=1 Tax=Mesorhabditis belari TaxID=2138241 RepID=A0AAF3F347_9BILA
MIKILAVLAVLGCALAQGQGQEPPFLQGISAALKQQFIAIQNNGALTDAQAEAQTLAWANTLPAGQKKVFFDLDAQGKQYAQQGRAQQAAAVARLSAAAQAFDKQMQALADNKSIPRAQKAQQIETLQKSAPAPVQKELQGVFATLSQQQGGR